MMGKIVMKKLNAMTQTIILMMTLMRIYVKIDAYVDLL